MGDEQLSEGVIRVPPRKGSTEAPILLVDTKSAVSNFPKPCCDNQGVRLCGRGLNESHTVWRLSGCSNASSGFIYKIRTRKDPAWCCNVLLSAL